MHEGSQKADFIVIAPNATLCVDVSITHPCAAHAVSRAATITGHAAKAREELKQAKHGEAARRMGFIFKPWVFESFGRWGSQVSKDMEALELYVAQPLVFRQSMRRTVALALQRANADMLVHAILATSRGLNRPSCTLASAAAQLLRPVRLQGRDAPPVVGSPSSSSGVLPIPAVHG